MKKVSIIIPNYNNADYIVGCLDSLLNQNYDNKEIIIVDDGSTDNSVEVIDKYISEHHNVEITLFCQNNLNAAIARNRGIELASGELALFMDSDDVLEEGALVELVRAFSDTGANLAIGNFMTVDVDDNVVETTKFTDTTKTIGVMENFANLADMSPAPMNKLYDLKLIKKHHITWGNVRIGQDLNFYLKYLVFCKKITLVNKNIYRYRLSNNSISRSYDLRIFDIVNTFEDVKKCYTENKCMELYDRYLAFVCLKHFNIQMTKQKFYPDKSTRNLVVRYFAYNAQRIDFSMQDKKDPKYKKVAKDFWLKIHLRCLFTSNLYCRYGRKKRCSH